jgi:hypothetical protein
MHHGAASSFRSRAPKGVFTAQRYLRAVGVCGGLLDRNIGAALVSGFGAGRAQRSPASLQGRLFAALFRDQSGRWPCPQMSG